MVLPPDYCEKCGIKHPPMTAIGNGRTPCEQAMAEKMLRLLMAIGDCDRCPSCNIDIFWVRFMSGARAPIQRNGINHITLCQGKYKKK